MIDSVRRRWLGVGAAVVAGRYGAPLGAAPVTELYVSLKRSVVAIGTFNRLRSPQFRFMGSGFVVGDGSRVATCAHVVAGFDAAASEMLAVGVPQNAADPPRIVEARMFGRDADADLATLDFAGEKMPALKLGPAMDAAEGTDVVMIGFPLGTTMGLIAAIHRGIVAAVTPSHLPAPTSAGLSAKAVQASRSRIIDLLQLDLTAYPGNSGSPLVDTSTGAVVGVLNMGLVKGNRETAFSQPTGISYAVPVKYLHPLAPGG